MKKIEQHIRKVKDFPKKGIIFCDIAPVLEDKKTFRAIINILAKKFEKQKIDKIIGIDARGFILAGALADRLKTGMVMIRKKGKLPYKTESQEFDLEYGKGILEIHKDAVKKGERILLIDDVLATGGTMLAATQLVEKLNGKIVGIAFLINLEYLQGNKKLSAYPLYSLINYKK
jgi:adenine phosphoribosyltransferase